MVGNDHVSSWGGGQGSSQSHPSGARDHSLAAPTAEPSAIRRKAWETRRAKYGAAGHSNAAYRPRPPIVPPGGLLVEIDNIGGFCPVQAEGRINGVEFYFRARGERWRMNIGGDVAVAPDWTYFEDWGEAPYEAGYMDLDIARIFIASAAMRWLNEAAA